MGIIPGGEPFFYRAGEAGCLLIHGFPGAPNEMRGLGEALATAGYTALGVRLRGHGTQPADLTRVMKEDWQADVEDGLAWLKGCTTKQIAVGLSLGGMLALNLAAESELAGVVVMATPWRLPALAHRLRPIIPVLSKLWRHRTPDEPSDWVDPAAAATNVHYPVQTLQAVGQVVDQLEKTQASLSQVSCPVLLLYSEGDLTAPPGHGETYQQHLGNAEVHLIRITRSGHNLPRDAAREDVQQHIADFAAAVLGAAG
jgi:carboxylesterase